MSDRGPAPRRPDWWQWSLPAGAAAAGLGGAITINVLADLVNNWLGSLAWVLFAVAVLGLVVNVLREVRGRRAAQQAAEPAPALPEQGPGVRRTLPYLSGFIGRDAELAAIVDTCGREHVVAVVGRRGVGTSSCAVRAADLLRDRFPRGQLYLDLRAGGRPMTSRQVLAALARTVGTAPPRSRRPAALADAATDLRARLDDQQTLLVLDNVDDPAQVRPLLPSTARCLLLLAGTPALAAVPGVGAWRLVEPDERDAVELFATGVEGATGGRARRVDPRTDPAVPELVALCGRQPRAVRGLAHWMARHGWHAADLLATARRATTTPPHEQTPFAAVLQLVTGWDDAYAALPRPARRLLRLLALVPGPLDQLAMAALAGTPPARLHPNLERLVADDFVDGAPGDRYQVRPLLRGYALLHLRYGEPLRRRVAAQVRLVRHLARRAERSTADPDGFTGRHQDLLHTVVTGGAAGLPRPVRRWWFRLAVALCGWYAGEHRVAEWAAVCRAVLATPATGERPEIAGWAHNELGVLRRRAGDAAGAVAMLRLAVHERGRRGTGQARTNLGLALLDLGQADEAVEQLELARRHRAPADRAGQALTELALGAAHLVRGDPVAHHHLVRAANSFHALGDLRGYAAALTNLVLVQWQRGEQLDAAQSWAAALRAHETLNDPQGRAAALLNAGAVLLAADPPRARQAYQLLAEARRLRERRRPTAGLGRTLLHLGDAAALLGRPDEARGHWVDAAGVGEATGDGPGFAAANARLHP